MRLRVITHRRLSFALQAVLLVGVVGAVWEQQWLNAVITGGIIVITLIPFLMHRSFRIFIPPEFSFLAIAFVFAALFLGEVRGYYDRFWWWDVALHISSGFLLGIVGFLLVHLLNEMEEIDVHLKAGFVAFFAFMFAVGMGALWEIFEYTAGRYFGITMLGFEGALTDTMWDLIVDTVGALVISVVGYGYLKTQKNDSFLERWITSFIRHNPQFFE